MCEGRDHSLVGVEFMGVGSDERWRLSSFGGVFESKSMWHS